MKLEQKCWKCFYKESRIGNTCFMYENTNECDYPKNENLSDASNNDLGQKPARQWKFIKFRIHISESKKPYLIEYVKSMYNAKQLAKLYLATRQELRVTQKYIERYPITPEIVIDAMVEREYMKYMDNFIAEECVIR